VTVANPDDSTATLDNGYFFTSGTRRHPVRRPDVGDAKGEGAQTRPH